MIQGGCPAGSGTGGPGFNIDAEFNDVHHERGILSMARAQDPNSAGSQFFVVHGEAGFLDNQYTAFGKLVDGFEAKDDDAAAAPLVVLLAATHRPEIFDGARVRPGRVAKSRGAGVRARRAHRGARRGAGVRALRLAGSCGVCRTGRHDLVWAVLGFDGYDGVRHDGGHGRLVGVRDPRRHEL